MWRGKLLALELDAPLHIGERVSGNLRQTRRFAPGRAIWGSLTQRLTRWAGGRIPSEFEATGREVHQHLRFSYGFVSRKADEVTEWPWEDREKFDWLYLQSYASTALADGRSKEDGSLHETEFIAPRTRSGERVYLLLYLWADEARFAADPLGAEFWAGYAMGGERGYGWGRMRRAIVQDAPKDLFGQWAIDEELGLRRQGGKEPAALGHVAGGCWRGRIEPLVGRETTNHSPGNVPSSAETVYVPGSRYVGGVDARFQIGEFGIWRAG